MATDSVRSKLGCAKNNLGLQSVKTSRFPEVCAAAMDQDMTVLMLSSWIVRVCDAAVPASGAGPRFTFDVQKEMSAIPHSLTHTVDLGPQQALPYFHAGSLPRFA